MITKPRGFGKKNLGQYRLNTISGKCGHTSNALIQKATQGKYVGTRVHRHFAAYLLGRHETRCANERTGRRNAAARAQFGNAKIDNLGLIWTIIDEKYI